MWRIACRSVRAPSSGSRSVRWLSSSSLSSRLPLPPRAPPADSSYSVREADSSFSSRSIAPMELEPPAVLRAPGSRTWVATSSRQLGPPGRIMLYASEVSVLLGHNTFRPLAETFERIWARTDPESYRWRIEQAEVETGRRLLTKEEEAEEMLARPEASQVQQHLQQILSRIVDFSADDLDQAKAELKAMAKSIPFGLGRSSLTAATLAEYLTSEVSKAYGIANEARAIAAYEKVAGLEVKENNSWFYGREIGECTLVADDLSLAVRAAATEAGILPDSPNPNCPLPETAPSPFLNDPAPLLLKRSFWVGGRVDGFSSLTGHLIEMKNRTRRFLHPMPKYDRCQMEVYLQVCEVESGELVERLRRRVTPSEAAREQARLRHIEAERRRDEEEAREIEQDWHRETANPDEQDVDFLAQRQTEAPTERSELNATIAIEPLVVPPSTLAQEDAEDADLEFLHDLRPLIVPLDVDEDTSFLSGPLAPASCPLADSPVAELAAGPPFEIFGTQQLAATPASQVAPSITHILIRESPMATAPLIDFDASTAGEGDDSASAHQIDAAFLAGFREAARPTVDEETTDASESTELPPLVSAASPASASPGSSSSSSVLFIDQLKRTVVHRSPSLWESEILPPLDHFSRFLTKFLADPQRQVEYLACQTDDEKAARLSEIEPPKRSWRNNAAADLATAHARSPAGTRLANSPPANDQQLTRQQHVSRLHQDDLAHFQRAEDDTHRRGRKADAKAEADADADGAVPASSSSR